MRPKRLPHELAEFGDRDFTAVARGLGARAAMIRTTDELAAADEPWLERAGPLVLDCKINLGVVTEGLAEASWRSHHAADGAGCFTSSRTPRRSGSSGIAGASANAMSMSGRPSTKTGRIASASAAGVSAVRAGEAGREDRTHHRHADRGADRARDLTGAGRSSQMAGWNRVLHDENEVLHHQAKTEPQHDRGEGYGLPGRVFVESAEDRGTDPHDHRSAHECPTVAAGAREHVAGTDAGRDQRQHKRHQDESRSASRGDESALDEQGVNMIAANIATPITKPIAFAAAKTRPPSSSTGKIGSSDSALVLPVGVLVAVSVVAASDAWRAADDLRAFQAATRESFAAGDLTRALSDERAATVLARLRPGSAADAAVGVAQRRTDAALRRAADRADSLSVPVDVAGRLAAIQRQLQAPRLQRAAGATGDVAIADSYGLLVRDVLDLVRDLDSGRRRPTASVRGPADAYVAILGAIEPAERERLDVAALLTPRGRDRPAGWASRWATLEAARLDDFRSIAGSGLTTDLDASLFTPAGTRVTDVLLTEANAARRRIVRDLHDGAQQRLVHSSITLGLAQRELDRDNGAAQALIAEALGHVQRANEELRELAHGILPADLARGGLRGGIDAVVERLDLAVEVDLPPERFPAEIEASAYSIVAEALTNVVKHARAESAAVTAWIDAGMLQVEVRDDGIGGADPGGRGLVGLYDRVTALGGQFGVESPAGGGTVLTATLPLGPGRRCLAALAARELGRTAGHCRAGRDREDDAECARVPRRVREPADLDQGREQRDGPVERRRAPTAESARVELGAVGLAAHTSQWVMAKIEAPSAAATHAARTSAPAVEPRTLWPAADTVVNAAAAELGRNCRTECRLAGSSAPASAGRTITPSTSAPIAPATLRRARRGRSARSP